jgi:hypothetical protein
MEQELLSLPEHLNSPPVFSGGMRYSIFSFICMFCRALFVLLYFFWGSMLLICLVFCVVLLCFYVLSLWCPLRFRIEKMFGLSLPSLVCRRARFLFMLEEFVDTKRGNQNPYPLWNICVTNDHGYVPIVVTTSRSFPHSWLITGFVTRLTRRVSLMSRNCLAFRSTWIHPRFLGNKPGDQSWMRKGPGSGYDNWNISVVICDTDIP